MENQTTDAVLNDRLELARRMVDVLADHKADDIVLLDIGKLASFADYFVICSASSDRQVKALTDSLTHDIEEAGVRAKRVEGTPESGWVLIDYADIVVHVFSAATRDYYRLEKIWAEAPTVVRVQ